MNTHVYKMIFMMVLLLSANTSQAATTSPPPTMAMRIPPSAVAAGEVSLVEVAPQTGAATTNDRVGLIIGNFLILCFYSFPMSYAENWAFGVPKKAKQQPKKESPEPTVDTETPSDEVQDSADEWTRLSKRLPKWAQRYPRAAVGLAAGGCLMVAVVILGAAAFALYYLISSQPERISQILPRFAYWFPFALLGMVTDVPFTARMFDLENRNKKVLVRLVVWWFPRFIIVAFMLNIPIVRDLDPATTALVVLAIDGVLAAFFVWLHTLRKQTGMKEVQL